MYRAAFCADSDWRRAVSVVAEAVLQDLGTFADFAFIAVSSPFRPHAESIAEAIDEALMPGALFGAVSEGVIGPGFEERRSGAITLLAGRGAPCVALELDLAQGGADLESSWSRLARAWTAALSIPPRALLLLADASSFPLERFLAWFSSTFPGVAVAGGRVACGEQQSLLFHGRDVFSFGATGLLVGAEDVSQVTCQGVRPIGDPLVVTSAEKTFITSIAGVKALDCLISLAQRRLSSDEVRVINEGGLHLGRLLNETADEPGPEDFAIAPVMGALPQTGALAAAEEFDVGEVVQFYIRDAKGAARALKRALRGKRPDGALLFLSSARGAKMHKPRRTEARLVHRLLRRAPLAGCLTQREIALVAGRPHSNALSASIALLGQGPR